MTLYQQYRPQQFQDLIGQPAAVRVLQQALRLERVAHAYLFSGPRGTGKTTTARIFARALVCENPVQTENGYEPCNQCAACTSVLNGHAPDFIEIDAASNRGIEDIRTLREQVQYPPIQLKRKIYLIDEVHMLTGDAFNAFLKTIEEPPAHCLFILATTEIHKVPGTIRSRCQLIRFERGSIDDLGKKLDHIVATEKWKVEKGVTSLIASHADGAFRDAETLLERLATQHQPLTLADAKLSLGIAEHELLESLITAALNNQTDQVRIHFATLQESAPRADQVTTQLIEIVRRKLSEVDVRKQPELLDPYVVALEQLLEAYILAKSSPLPLLPLEIACLTISQYTSGKREHAIIAEPPPAEPIASSVSVPVTPAEPIASSVSVPVAPTPQVSASVPVVEIRDAKIADIRKAWKVAVDEIARTNLPLGQMLRDAVFHSAESGTIHILVRYKFHAEKLNEKKNRHNVEVIMEELTGKTWQLKVELGENLPKRQPKKELGAASDQAVHDATAVFGA